MSNKKPVMPFAWYGPATYARLYEISADNQRMPKTFEKWEERAQLQFDELRRRGMPVEKVFVDPEALVDWADGAAIDSNKRAGFAAFTFVNEREKRH